jgi:adrenodoxin-NADP+ reductase
MMRVRANNCGRLLFRKSSAAIYRLNHFSTTNEKADQIRCTIVGSGPAGFYTAKYLLEKNKCVTVDMIETLPTPYGLVRQGVAPDHQEVKSVMATFVEVATQPRFRFFGNVSVGGQDVEHSSNAVSIAELKKAYDIVVLAYGASSDRALGIPGEELSGVISARNFVNWYNGHPSYNHIGQSFDLGKIKRVVVVGQGNVAIDCARILMKGVDELRSTDISSQALKALEKSSVEEVVIVGRRGHIQASFTIKELRELTKLADVNVKISQSELNDSLTESSQLELKNNRPKHRIVDLINKIATDTISTESSGESKEKKSINFRFLLSPVEILPSADASAVGSIVLLKNKLIGAENIQKAVSTGQSETMNCELILKSVGYKSESMIGVPFDFKKNVIPNDQGRVVDIGSIHYDNGNLKSNEIDDLKIIDGLYVTGWLKRGPSGIIGTNITDAKETVDCILQDILRRSTTTGHTFQKCDPILTIPVLSSEDVITWEDYLRIEAEENRRGDAATPKKPREKICSVTELLSIAKNRL